VVRAFVLLFLFENVRSSLSGVIRQNSQENDVFFSDVVSKAAIRSHTAGGAMTTKRAQAPPPTPTPTTTTNELVSYFEQIQAAKLSDDVRRTAACNVLRVFVATEWTRERSEI
jgi:hypothetical protein